METTWTFGIRPENAHSSYCTVLYLIFIDNFRMLVAQ